MEPESMESKICHRTMGHSMMKNCIGKKCSAYHAGDRILKSTYCMDLVLGLQ